jgi:type IV secretion system protein VirB3
VNEPPEPPVRNPLFLAVTRPALWAGIPIEAAVLLLISSASVLIWSNSPVYAALVVAFGYSISRLIVRHDVNAFRLLFLWGRTKARNRNRAFWGGSSYTPLPLAGLRRSGFGRRG